MEGQQPLYSTLPGASVTEDIVARAARLFSDNYGTWDQQLSGRKGRIKLSPRRLRDQHLPAGAATTYTSVAVDGNLVGHAFASRWKCGDKTVCWVTQLVVAKEYRRQGLATGLLRALRESKDDVYGIVSSHPAACMAASRAFGKGIERLDVDFIRKEAAAILEASPVPYIKQAKLSGFLSDVETSTGIVSVVVDTAFFVDHGEPMEALELLRKNGRDWPLGELPDGHEFLVLLEAS